MYLLKHKSQAFDVFKSFKAMAKKESNKIIKVLRSDGGGEYMSNEFIDFCKYHGIKRHSEQKPNKKHEGSSSSASLER